MEINFASSDSLRLGGRWVREGESVTKWGNRSNISHLLIGCKTIYMWWGDIAWFFELLHLQWFVKLSHGWKGPNVKKKIIIIIITPDTHISEDLDWTSKTSVDYPPPPLGVLQVDRAGAWLTDIWLLLAEDYLAAPTHKKLAAAPSSPALQSSGGESLGKTKTSMINETPVCFALWCFNSMPVSNFEILECPTCFCVHSSDQCQKQRPPL